MDIFLLYLLTRLDTVIGLSIGLMIAFGMGALFGFLFGNIDGSDEALMWGRRSLIGFAICAAVFAVTPSQKDALFIVAGVGVIEAAKTDTAKRLASKSVQIIEDFLDGQLKKKESAR